MRTRSTLLVTTLLALLLPSFSLFARQGTPPRSRETKVLGLPAVRQLAVQPTDVAAELAEDARRANPIPLRYAVPSAVLVNPLTDGTWEIVPGGRLWRLRVASEGATDLNFGFARYWLPAGATLHIHSEDGNYFQGPYSARDNKPHGELWTPVIPGDRAVIELFVPDGAEQEPRLLLSRVNRGYRDLFHRRKDFSVPKAGSCNNDVVCPAGDPWRNEIRSVARYSVGGSSFCTGTLINNVSNDFKNYFLTAAHCGITAGNASSVMVYWNYESPVCGQHGGGSLSQNQGGAILRMSKSDVDVALIELEDIPDTSFHVYYSGWDRATAAPSSVVGIHHPNADEKSISFSDTAPTTVDSCIGPGNNTHWEVVWNSGVTEPGSSGSGIWNPATKRLIGTLSGGDASCALPQGPDCYGKFSVAWNSGNNAGSRLLDWLDPANTGAMSANGRDPNPVPLIVAAGSAIVNEECTPTNGVIDPGESVTVSLSLRNFGASNSINLVATLLATNGVTSPGAPQSYGVVVAGGPAVTRNFTFVATGACGSVISPRLQLQDGTNNRGAVAFTFRLGTPVVTFTQRFDSVVATNLPSGWVNAVTNSPASSNSPGWRTSASLAHTTPNAAFATNREFVTDATLTSPSIPILTTNAQVLFHHYIATEEGFDGGVLEASINNGPWNDIIVAGGSYVAGEYDTTIPFGYQSPIAGRDAWSGNSGGFLQTVVNLPVSAAGQNIRLRWRMATDESVAAVGWFVDTVSIIDGYACCIAVPTLAPQIIETRHTNDAIVFSFHTQSNKTYVTEYRDKLQTNVAWVPLQTNAGDGTKKTVTNTATLTNRFFRVKAQ